MIERALQTTRNVLLATIAVVSLVALTPDNNLRANSCNSTQPPECPNTQCLTSRCSLQSSEGEWCRCWGSFCDTQLCS
jgi:hypothetical protein